MANIITVCRMVLSVILLFTTPLSIWFYILYGACGATDILDGFVARLTGKAREKGAILDSVEDIFFFISVSILCMRYRTTDAILYGIVIVIAIYRVLNVVLGYIKYKKIIFIHTVANKMTGGCIFLLPWLIGTDYIRKFAFAACIVAVVATVQEGHYIRSGKIRHR